MGEWCAPRQICSWRVQDEVVSSRAEWIVVAVLAQAQRVGNGAQQLYFTRVSWRRLDQVRGNDETSTRQYVSTDAEEPRWCVVHRCGPLRPTRLWKINELLLGQYVSWAVRSPSLLMQFPVLPPLPPRLERICNARLGSAKERFRVS